MSATQEDLKNLKTELEKETERAGNSSPKPRRPPRPLVNPDKYLMRAKEVVLENYNGHRDPAKSQPLTLDDVFIMQFSEVVRSWKAIVTSPVARGLLWEVSYNGFNRETYIDVYSKVNSSRISPAPVPSSS